MSKKQEEALRMRDLAWSLMRSQGKFEDFPGAGPHLSWEGQDLKMILRTPFGKLPTLPCDPAMAALMPKSKKNLPYGLDIWDTAGKVLNIEWDRDGTVRLIKFRRGVWQNLLEELATE